MKRLLCIITAIFVGCFTISVYSDEIGDTEEIDYPALHMSLVGNHEIIPWEVTIQYLIGESERQEDIVETQKKIRDLAASVTEGIDGDYEKARAISAWVAENIFYDRVARDNEVTLETINLKNVLELRRTVCSGYANLTAALLAAEGIKSVTVLGNTSFNDENPTGNPHEWTAFWYEGEERWVLLDSGWDSFNYYDGEYVERERRVKFFDLSAEGFSEDHRARKAEFRDWFNGQSANYNEEPFLEGEIDTDIASRRDGGEVEEDARRSMIIPIFGGAGVLIVTIIIFIAVFAGKKTNK
ncbi:MAG: transglutaminase-like domain-containing protein [Oscillospiraceae bacterium]|nr:transglutaminase-like domain-containing protein [Oscillospiraceae bacterium]